MTTTIKKSDIDRLKALIREREPKRLLRDFSYEIEFIVRHIGDANPQIEVWVSTSVMDSKHLGLGYHHYWQFHPNGEWQKDDENVK